MQKRLSDFLLLLFLGIIVGTQFAYSQGVNSELNAADSLFNQRRYTQSLDIYERIYQESESATPAMLLKMAYSEEALGNLSKALIYLHDYYRLTADKRVLKKMDELAQVNGLQGYETNDLKEFLESLQDFKLYIISGILALALLIVGMIFRKIQKHQTKSPGLALGLVLVLALGIYFINFSNTKELGIITADSSYVMSGPSAAAELMEVVNQGHKVEILDKNDIWFEIKWRGKRAFVRENNLQKLL